ncbi:ABC transporter permease [Cohnella faecalis]|uniref:ABC transporter permease n=1 Tax=Cohnella faecalis TaxID=2315694 RepID=A0A398CKH8_9BACL|nr:ABC transporter permease [Cohnella faecalis]RIE00397.1 ABC transporter permease [Cohnella faecalis]
MISMPYTQLVRGGLKTGILYLIFAVSFLVVGFFVEGFGGLSHLSYLIQIAGFLGIVAAGQNMIMLTGGIDLSCGMIISFCGIVFAQLINSGYGFLGGILLTLLCGSLLGLANGLGVSFLKVPALVMTLATASVYQGISMVMTNGRTSSITAEGFQGWVNDKWFFGFNGVVFTWLVVILVVVFLLTNTKIGKKIYYSGSNMTAAVHSGINPKSVSLFVFTSAGFLYAIVGILLVGFTARSYFTMGNTYQFMSIAAVVVGGTSILGGKGSYLGTIAGALLLTLIQSLLILFKIPYGGQLAAQGAIILALVIIYSLQSPKQT